MRLAKLAVLVLLMSLGGICRLRPRGATLGRLGVVGPDATLRSSLEALRESINNGDGDSTDLKPWEDQGLRFSWYSGGISNAAFSLAGSPLPSRVSWWVI